MTGKTPFAIYQGDWSVLRRDLEREIVPMARSEGAFVLLPLPSRLRTGVGMQRLRLRLTTVHAAGLALAPFDVLAGGKIRTDEEEERRRQTGEKGPSFEIYTNSETETDIDIGLDVQVVQ